MSILKIYCLFFIYLLVTGTVYTGNVLRVIDGDTFVLQTTEGSLKIRLDGIDCPEHDQAFGPEATEFLRQYEGMDCKVVKKGLDRYGRTIGVLWIDSVNINLLMVKEGYAWHFKKYSKDAALAKAEIEAKRLKKGLWKDEGAVAPWEWRKR